MKERMQRSHSNDEIKRQLATEMEVKDQELILALALSDEKKKMEREKEELEREEAERRNVEFKPSMLLKYDDQDCNYTNQILNPC